MTPIIQSGLDSEGRDHRRGDLLSNGRRPVGSADRGEAWVAYLAPAGSSRTTALGVPPRLSRAT